MNVIYKHQQDKVESYIDEDAKIINQMIFSKLQHVRLLLSGVNYISKNGIRLNTILDPTVIASTVRNIFETICLFHLIFIDTKSHEEKDLLYQLWVISGLKYRQRFSHVATTEESKELIKSEEKQISERENKVKSSELYKSLSFREQEKILKKIKAKDYKIRIEGNIVKYLSWQDMFNLLDCETTLFDSFYTYFSLYSHPSNVSVDQFAQMFDKEDLVFAEMTRINLKYCFVMLSVFIADYIKLFPKVLETYNNLPVFDQIIINSYNRCFRDEKYSINDSWKHME